MLASVKFWHAWTNGVTVEWLARKLVSNGCVSHFILILRNPVRITISEMYGHKYSQWSYRGSGGAKGIQKTACARSHLAYHIGATWVGQMASAHYQGFVALQNISSSRDLPALGMSYESDILPSAHKTYLRVLGFLGLQAPPEQDPPRAAKKGMLCPLSSMLVNFEELKCSLSRWEREHGLGAEGLAEVDTSADRPLSLEWMAGEWDDEAASFERVMDSWRRLREGAGGGHISECSFRDMLDDSNPDPAPRRFQSRSSPRRQGEGLCGEGGETELCKVREALVIFTALLLYNATSITSYLLTRFDEILDVSADNRGDPSR